MATFMATTACNGPRLKDAEAAAKVLERFYWEGEGDIEVTITMDSSDGQAHLMLYGYDWPGAYKIPDNVSRDEFEPNYDIESYDGFQEFLRDIAPHLADPLTVQSIGSEKCRFPLAACEWHILPGDSKIQVNDFQHSLDEPFGGQP